MMTGTQFNAQMAGIKMYKILNDNMVHYDYTYEPNALNDLSKTGEQFDSDPDCKPGGLYFCAESDMIIWISTSTCLIALIEIPEDAQISIGENKFKTDKMILGQPKSFDEFFSDTYLRTMPVNYLWAGSWYNLNVCELAKRSYVLGPDRFDFESKANLLFLVGMYYNGAEFLNSIKADVQTMLEDPVFRTHLAKTIKVVSVKSREWFDSNFPQHTDLLTALGLKVGLRFNFPFDKSD